MLVIVLSKRVNVAALLLNRRIAAQANREMCRIPASAETRLREQGRLRIDIKHKYYVALHTKLISNLHYSNEIASNSVPITRLQSTNGGPTPNPPTQPTRQKAQPP
jgi:hypothetical protein